MNFTCTTAELEPLADTQYGDSPWGRPKEVHALQLWDWDAIIDSPSNLYSLLHHVAENGEPRGLEVQVLLKSVWRTIAWLTAPKWMDPSVNLKAVRSVALLRVSQNQRVELHVQRVISISLMRSRWRTSVGYKLFVVLPCNQMQWRSVYYQSPVELPNG